jgi:hypothetical protein
MAVLLSFNIGPCITQSAQTIQVATQLEDKDLFFALQVLTKNKILNAVPPTMSSYSPEQEFTRNADFKSANRKIALHLATQQGGDGVAKQVVDDRKLTIQAAIVRIMKARKRTTHLNLINEVVPLLQRYFQPNVLGIKKVIEELMTPSQIDGKPYMKRADDDTLSYEYVA